MKKLKNLALMLLAATVVYGCNGGGGSDGSNPSGNPTGNGSGAVSAISGVASKGPINGGTVKVYALNEDGSPGSLLGTTTTAADGQYSVNLGTYAGNVLVEVTGGTYTDEATGSITPMNALSLRAALTGLVGNAAVAVTPLTEMAVSKAGVLSRTNIDAANSLVGSMIGGIDIVGTMPVEVTTSTAALATKGQKEYSLMLAVVSQMAKDSGKSVSDVIAALKSDISDGKIDDTTVIASLGNFMSSGNNGTGMGLSDTTLSGSLLSTGGTSPNVGKTDLEKAKALISDLRSTALTIHNYKGSGTTGFFNDVVKESETKIKPELTAIVDKVGWILEKARLKLSKNYTNFTTGDQLFLTFTNANNDLGFSSASFTVKDAGYTTIDTGTLTVISDGNGQVTSGTFSGTMKTSSGNLTANMSYTGTVSGGFYTAMTLTGNIAEPGLSLDFSESGRKLYATFAQQPGSSVSTEIYPTGLVFSGLLTTENVKMNGELNVSSIVWADKGRITSSTSACVGESRPKAASFTGSFEGLKNGSATGVKFNGKITANWTNADTYDGCKYKFDTTYRPDHDSASNYHRWKALFNGTIEGPSRPTITASLGIVQSDYNKFLVDALYKSMNGNGTMVFLTGNGTMMYYPKPLGLVGEYSIVSTANFTNQDGIKLAITDDERNSGDNKLSGTIRTSGGEKLADIYTMNSLPMVKFTDDYFESIP